VAQLGSDDALESLVVSGAPQGTGEASEIGSRVPRFKWEARGAALLAVSVSRPLR